MTPSIKLLWILLPLTFRVRPNLPESVASTASALHLADPMLDDEPVLPVHDEAGGEEVGLWRADGSVEVEGT